MNEHYAAARFHLLTALQALTGHRTWTNDNTNQHLPGGIPS